MRASPSHELSTMGVSFAFIQSIILRDSKKEEEEEESLSGTEPITQLYFTLFHPVRQEESSS